MNLENQQIISDYLINKNILPEASFSIDSLRCGVRTTQRMLSLYKLRLKIKIELDSENTRARQVISSLVDFFEKIADVNVYIVSITKTDNSKFMCFINESFTEHFILV
jgi:hypothetical protein